MNVRARLILTLFTIGLLFAVPATYAVDRLTELRDIATDLRLRHAEAYYALGQFHETLTRTDRFQLSFVVTEHPSTRDEVLRALDEASRFLARIEGGGYGDAMDRFGLEVDSLLAGSHELIALVETGQREAASRFIAEELRPILDGLSSAAEEVAAVIDERSGEEVRQAQAISEQAAVAVLIGLLLAGLVALLVGAWTTGAITGPLLRLRGGMAQVAAGSFTEPDDLPEDRSDEIGDLTRSFLAMTRNLAELDRLRAEFIGVASHELKTPIHVIGGYARLIEDGMLGEVDPKQRGAIAAMREQAENLDRLITELLDLSQIEAGRFPLRWQELSIDALLESVEAAFTVLAREKSIELTVERLPGLPKSFSGDPDRLRNEVLGNLLSNALKFTPEGGTVFLRAAPDGHGGVRIEVKDSGGGIPEESIARIFEKYYRVRPDGRHAGSGLGLAIAREVVEAHGGEIGVTSRIGEGTTFHVRLPARAGSRDEVGVHGGPAEPGSLLRARGQTARRLRE